MKYKFVPYMGNKNKDIDIIKQYIPSFKCIVDVFGGSGCVGISLKQDNTRLVYNDNGKKIIKLIKIIRRLDRYIDYIEEWNNDKDYIRCKDVNECRERIMTKIMSIENEDFRFLIMCFHSIFGNYIIKEDIPFTPICDLYKGLYKGRQVKIDFNTLYDTYKKINKVEHKDYKKVLKEYKNCVDTFLYMDPPYLNTKFNYNNSFNNNDVEYIFQYMRECDCKVMLNVEYKTYKDYITKYNMNCLLIYDYTYNTAGKNNNQHCIITNY